MSIRQARHQGRRGAARRPIPGIALALAIACAGGVGGLVLASFATGGTRFYAGTTSYVDETSADYESRGFDVSNDDRQSALHPDDYRCRGCGPGLAARMAAQYGSDYYDGAAYGYAAPDADDDAYPTGGGISPPPYRPLPFDGESTSPPAASAPAPRAIVAPKPAAPPVVKPVTIAAVPERVAPLPTDRMPLAPGAGLLAPAASQDQPAGGQAKQQQR